VLSDKCALLLFHFNVKGCAGGGGDWVSYNRSRVLPALQVTQNTRIQASTCSKYAFGWNQFVHHG
jgi:hypothetical protein